MMEPRSEVQREWTIPPHCITATERIDGVPYLVVLEPDGRGRYREADLIPLEQLEAKPAARGAFG